MPMDSELAYEIELQRSGEFMLREASAFFDGGDRLRETLRRLSVWLEAEGIAYALVEGLALAEHGYPRLTEDIDILPLELAERLHPSVALAYKELWKQVQVAKSEAM